jgi:hypothetical protein
VGCWAERRIRLSDGNEALHLSDPSRSTACAITKFPFSFVCACSGAHRGLFARRPHRGSCPIRAGDRSFQRRATPPSAGRWNYGDGVEAHQKREAIKRRDRDGDILALNRAKLQCERGDDLAVALAGIGAALVARGLAVEVYRSCRRRHCISSCWVSHRSRAGRRGRFRLPRLSRRGECSGLCAMSLPALGHASAGQDRCWQCVCRRPSKRGGQLRLTRCNSRSTSAHDIAVCRRLFVPRLLAILALLPRPHEHCYGLRNRFAC